MGFLAAAHMVAPERRAMHDILPRRNIVMDMKAGDDVVEHGQLPEQPDLLERARDARVARAGAPASRRGRRRRSIIGPASGW